MRYKKREVLLLPVFYQRLYPLTIYYFFTAGLAGAAAGLAGAAAGLAGAL
jgi:hypothetical protein